MDALLSHLNLDDLNTARSDITTALLTLAKGESVAQVRIGDSATSYQPSDVAFLKELGEIIARLIARKQIGEARSVRAPFYVELG
ncbi:hypothetical protein D5125_02780 [Magnetovirga frankeli]|uniref:hypothetical protein n=1 Tax=Magnetovirga frankeli TaxID=947516 RepID=UPI00129306AC|nr:hypothetical protein D5125_02780 [gamma proteobacterium SS-5]